MKSFSRHITEETEPKTLCWYLSQDTPNEFYEAVRKVKVKKVGDEISGISHWYGGDWVYTGKMSNKTEGVKGIVAAHKCRDRSAWANGKGGKLYRGFRRTIQEVSKYKYTGETKVAGPMGDLFLVATMKYKPKHAAQSWTRNFNVAEEFSISVTGVADKEFDTFLARGPESAPVIVMANVPDSDTVFSDAVSQKLFQISYQGGQEEHEVIRVSDKPIDVVCYVNLTKWVTSGSIKYRPGETDAEWVLRTFGKDAGMKFLSKPKFVKLLPMKAKVST